MKAFWLMKLHLKLEVINVFIWFQKSVIAILDCMINPDWHGIVPVNENDKEKSKEEQWSKIPDIPMRYHFFYRILDGDRLGRSPKTDDGRIAKDEDFDFKGRSCFEGLLRSPHKGVCIKLALGLFPDSPRALQGRP